MNGLSAAGLADLAGVPEAVPPASVVFSEAGEVGLKGFARPVRLLEARRA
jgi:class 3 adenylate cyclase